jgi:putative ABC transport system substrate-binding protein
MDRRRFILATAGSGLAAVARAQTAATVGILLNGGASFAEPIVDSFRKGYAALGYAEGRGFALAPRYAQGQLDRLPALAAELVQLDVSVIMALGGPAARAAKNASTRIPVVFSIVTDPVALGLVASLEHPGGNVTGVTSLDPEQATHQMSLIRTVFPQLRRLGILSDATIPGADSGGLAPIDRANDAAARKLGMEPVIHKMAGGPAPDFAGVLDAMVRDRAEALLVLEVPVPFAHRKKVAELASARLLPSIFPGGQADAGGMITYGTSVAETWPRLPILVDKILKGAKAGGLAVERHTRRELVINLKLAHAFGLTVPDDVLKRADHVIE